MVESLLENNGKNLDAWTLLNGPEEIIRNAPGPDTGKSLVDGAGKYLKYFICPRCQKKYSKKQLRVWRYANKSEAKKGYFSVIGSIGFKVRCPKGHLLLDVPPI